MKKRHLTLLSSEIDYLEELTSKGNLSAKKFNRAKALLGLDRGQTFQEAASISNVSYQTVSNWCEKYKIVGLSFLEDKPRSGRPAQITKLQEAKITALACSEAPNGRSKWTLRLLADKIVELGYLESISHNQVGVILKKMNSNHI